MIFSSASFFVFLLVTLAIYAGASTQRQRAGVLLAASLIFYASWKPAYLLLLMASLGINYQLFQRMLRRRSRALLVAAVALNLAFLGVAKYLAFATSSALALAMWIGLEARSSPPSWMVWALPLGISFYTFHMLSAMFDLHRGVWAKPVSFPRWCLYVTFFPHLIAGPILRPGQLIDQLGDLAPLRVENFRLGGAIFVGGLVKKVLLADNLAPIADAAFSSPSTLDAAAAWTGSLAFAFQIYFDFSGYSEMAIGLALLFGVALPRNFLYPYLSRSPSEFWRRWHITLSQWLRDYLYIALGGNRMGVARTYVNLAITMLLGGLWHGAAWTFVAWGALHGAYLVGQRLMESVLMALRVQSGGAADRALSAAGIPLTFLLVHVAWVFFRAPDFGNAWTMLTAMSGVLEPASGTMSFRRYEVALVAAAAVLALVEPRVVGYFERRGVDDWWRVPFVLRGVAYAGLVLTIIAFGGATQKFIYFDF